MVPTFALNITPTTLAQINKGNHALIRHLSNNVRGLIHMWLPQSTVHNSRIQESHCHWVWGCVRSANTPKRSPTLRNSQLFDPGCLSKDLDPVFSGFSGRQSLVCWYKPVVVVCTETCAALTVVSYWISFSQRQCPLPAFLYYSLSLIAKPG